MRKPLVAFGLGLLAGSVTLAEPAPALPTTPRTIAAADLRSDADLLLKAYEALHPGLHRYRTPAEIDAAHASLMREFGRDRTLADAYLAISRFTTFIECGHTYANFYNQGDAVRDALLRSPRVPFEFRWIERRMIVTRSFAETPELRRGTEVLAIDGHPASRILDGLLPYSRADGANTAKRIANLEVQGFDRIEAFDVFFPLVFPRGDGAPFELVVRPAPGAAARKIQVPAMAYDARPQRGGDPDGDANPWEYRDLRPGVGYLRMGNWALYDSKFDWQSYLEEVFADLVARQVPDLVIDLRGNEGGLSVGDVLLAHLTTGDLPAEPVVRKTRYRKVPDEFRPVLSTWDKSFYDWGDAAVDLGDGFFRLTKYDDDPAGAVVRAKAPRYAGRVWVLIGAVNSSATFEFASAIRRNRLGTLVGQPTGGNQRGITGGAFFFMTLPKTGIEVDVPLIGQFPVSSTPLPDAGLEPDVYVQPTVRDIADGRDVELAAVLTRIGK